MEVFIFFCLLHLIGDFYLQSNMLAKCKESRVDEDCKECNECLNNKIKSFNFKKIVNHVLIYIIPFILSMIYAIIYDLFDYRYGLNILDALLGIIIISVTHVLIDIVSCIFKRRSKKSIVFIFDQVFHFLVIYIISKSLNIFDGFVISENIEIFNLLFVILFVSKPTSIFISLLFVDIYKDEKQGFGGPGSYIGIFERLIIVALFYLQSVSLISIIIAAKTLVRYNDIKKDEENFQTKFLIGTLASIAITLICLLLLIYIL